MNHYFEVTAIAAEKDRLTQYGKDNGVNTFYVDLTREITPVKDLKAVWKLYRYFRKEKPEIVHTHTPKAGIVGMCAAWLARVPLRLHTVAGLPLMETTGLKRKLLNFVEKTTYKFATRVYPNSRGLKQIILNEGFAKESELKILGRGSSNGIDTSYFNPEKYSEDYKKEFREKLEIPSDAIVFIFIGRLVSEKGINELVAAFQKLYAEDSFVRLLLVGPFETELDPLTPSTMETIKAHSAIISVGYQQDVRPFLSIADVLAFPSYREGFPNVVMQAGAMNLGSIVTDINGCNEIIITDKNGLIIPPKDEQALFKAMKTLTLNRELRTKFQRKSRQMICENYDRKEFWNCLLDEYRNLEQSLR